GYLKAPFEAAGFAAFADGESETRTAEVRPAKAEPAATPAGPLFAPIWVGLSGATESKREAPARRAQEPTDAQLHSKPGADSFSERFGDDLAWNAPPKPSAAHNDGAGSSGGSPSAVPGPTF